ncbi:hypothetical protein [Metabacillus arenae]|uniref:Uncharacterized protein n=1 Tax=Metabacillus arenae TaxID=2771434 RepID=A0A926NJA8_9BACI|nr:hypothetical protein [Metabacillus arenae]MBD1379152.1 hypothetical protein [Metabacillus arenae]
MNPEYKKISRSYKWKITHQITKEKVENVDTLLDEYNDYMTLFKNFGDMEYKTKAEKLMLKIKIMAIV